MTETLRCDFSPQKVDQKRTRFLINTNETFIVDRMLQSDIAVSATPTFLLELIFLHDFLLAQTEFYAAPQRCRICSDDDDDDGRRCGTAPYIDAEILHTQNKNVAKIDRSNFYALRI